MARISGQERLTALTREVGQLRGMSTADAPGAVRELLPDLAALCRRTDVDQETLRSLITRAHRAIYSRAPLADTAAEALSALRAQLAAGPVSRGRRPVGPPTTVRLAVDVYERVDQIAEDEGYVKPSGEPARAEVLRVLIDEALATRETR